MRKLILSLLAFAVFGYMTSADAARPGGGSVGVKTPSYTAKNLGVLTGDVQSLGFGVSEAGSVVGASLHYEYDSALGHDIEVWRAFYWDGAMHNLTTDQSQGHAFAVAGSQRGSEYVVGYETTPGTGTHAAMWIAANTPTMLLDHAETSSTAWGVNGNGVAVGDWGNSAAIWTPSGTGYSRTTFYVGTGQITTARGINGAGIVVGYAFDPNDQTKRNAYVRLASGNVLELGAADTYVYTDAFAVSDNVRTSDNKVFVYVSGSMTKADGTQSAARWTVDVTAGTVSAPLVLSKQWSAGVNIDGDMSCTASSGGRQGATLFRSGVYLTLKPPKGATDAASYGLAGTKSPVMYVVGVAQVSGLRAVLWEVR